MVPPGGVARVIYPPNTWPDDVYSNSGTGYGVKESCSDSTGRGVDHGLFIERERFHYVPINGQHPPDPPPYAVKRVFANWRPEVYEGPGCLHSAVVELPPLDLQDLRAKLLARSNPSRADVDLAVSIGELRTLPRDVLRGAQDFIREAIRSPSLRRFLQNGALRFRRNPLQEGAGGYLGVQFGLIPLVNDVKGIMKYQELVGNRLREIANLRDGNGIRRRINLGFTQIPGPESVQNISSTTRLVIDARVQLHASRRIWGTVRWKPDPLKRVPDTDARRVMEARRAAYGLNVDLSTAYNLMPWSWLVDYFSNVGDLIDATRNDVGAVPGNTNIMVHTMYARVATPLLPDGLTGGSAVDVLETKERFIGSGFTGLNSTIPILSNRQVSILGALAISRLPKR